MKKVFPFLFGIIFVFTSLIMPTNSHANGIPFDVRPILPNNQDPNVTSYVSIKADSDSINQNLEFVLKNNTDKAQDVEINVVDAYTSPNGVVQYINKKQENSFIVDETYKLSNYLTFDGENKITLKANEERKITTKLAVEKLDGVLLGGVSFKTLQEGGTTEQENASFRIDNEINMVIGVMVDFGTDKNVELDIGEPYVDPMPAYYAIRLPVSLNAPLLKELTLDYEVYYKGEKLFGNNGTYDFAPMSGANVSLAWEHEEIKQNTPYVLKGSFSYKDTDNEEKTVEFEKEFIFENKEEQSVFSALTTPIVKNNSPYLLIALFILLAIGLAYYLKQRAKTYVLFSEDSAPNTISSDHELYNALQKKKSAVNRNNASKMHIYAKKKLSKTKEIYYAYRKTKSLTNKKS